MDFNKLERLFLQVFRPKSDQGLRRHVAKASKRFQASLGQNP